MVQQRRRRGKIRGPGPGRSKHPKTYKIVCAACGKEVVVQIPPLADKKLLCIECFKK